MAVAIAVVIDGVWVPLVQPPPSQDQPATPDVPAQEDAPKVDTHVVELDAARSNLDQITAHLGSIVRLAQDLSEDEARRARLLVQACSGALTASTMLPAKDQAKFVQSMRRGK